MQNVALGTNAKHKENTDRGGAETMRLTQKTEDKSNMSATCEEQRENTGTDTKKNSVDTNWTQKISDRTRT